MKELIALLSKLEGKKSQVSIGDIRELMRILAEVLANDERLLGVFMKYMARKKKK